MQKDIVKLESKKRLFSKLQGEHKSIFSGSGVEFLELREYTVFDNAKHINWKRSLSSTAPLVNIYSDDRELNIVVVYLVSGSLEYRAKKEVAREVVATLSLSATVFKQRLNVLFFSTKEELFLEGIRGLESYDISYDAAQGIEHFGKKIDYKRVCHFLSNHLKERSVIFLVGDFLDSGVDLAQISFNHEVYAILVRDRSEEHIEAMGHKEFKDPIALKIKKLFISKSSAKMYNRAFSNRDNRLIESFNQYGIRYVKIYDTKSIYLKLKRVLSGE